MLKGFRHFLLRGNMVDMATGIVFGAAFSGLVTAMVSTFFTPLIGLAIGQGGLATHTAKIAGATFNYGAFINTAFSFFLTMAVLYFFVVKPLTRLIPKPNDKAPCPACFTDIPVKATRCFACTTAVLPQEPGSRTSR